MFRKHHTRSLWPNTYVSTTIIALLLLCFATSGCDRKESSAIGSGKQNKNIKTQTDDFRAGFTSKEGNYSMPIDYSTEAVIVGIGPKEVMWEFIQRHSKHNLWTYVLTSDTNANEAKASKSGWDKFTREFGSELAQIQIMWSPMQYSNLKQDFDNTTKLYKSLGTWINDSQAEIEIDKNRGLIGRFKINLGDRTMYSTFIIVHTSQRRYQIQYSYTKGFSDPDNTFEKIKQIEFHRQTR